jgi:anti-sigma-K factor RskA
VTHSELDGAYELYILGALEYEAAAEIDAHIADQCDHCLQQLREAAELAAALPAIAEQVQPPRHLRKRILESIAPVRNKRMWQTGFWSMAAVSLALLAVCSWSVLAVLRHRAVETELRAERNQLRAALETLSRTDMHAVQFGKAEGLPHGRVFSNPAGFVFVGARLPEVAADKTLELWLIPASGAPIPAGLFRPDARGDSVKVTPSPVGQSKAVAVAVTVEPRTGSPAPTTKPFLIVPLA